MEFNEIVTYPMNRDDWLKTLLIGGVLILFGVLIVPLFVAYGYIVRTIGGSLAGEAQPPAFNRWGELFLNGVQAWLISIVYLLVPLLVAGVTVGGSIAAIATGGETAAVAGAGGLLIGLSLSAVLALAFGYLAVVAVVNFARENRFGAAFDFETIKTVAVDRVYRDFRRGEFRRRDPARRLASRPIRQFLRGCCRREPLGWRILAGRLHDG